jgi:hypothetical protein
MQSIDGCIVEPVSRREASQIILKYEWLGSLGKSTQCYGLRTPTGELAGVVSFGPGPVATRCRLFGGAHLDKMACLERGACVHWAHPHAGSFLISRALKLATADFGWEVFFAYSDPEAAEIGTVYQATNWLYFGHGPGRKSKNGKRYALRPPWVKKGDTAHYWSTSRLLSGGPPLNGQGTFGQARELGWTIEEVFAKHVYLFLTRRRKPWLRRLAERGWLPQSYPKRVLRRYRDA